MKSSWPINVVGAIIGLVALMLALANLQVLAVLMLILALTIILLPYRRGETFLYRRKS